MKKQVSAILAAGMAASPAGWLRRRRLQRSVLYR